MKKKQKLNKNNNFTKKQTNKKYNFEKQILITKT